MSTEQRAGRWTVWGPIVGLLIGVAGIALWRVQSPDPAAVDPVASAVAPAVAPDAPAALADEPDAGSAPGVRAPAQRIPSNGRLMASRAALRDGDVLAVGLDMPDAARGETPIEVKVADVRGRVIDLMALPVDEPGAGVRLEIDPDWLEPGRYMIQVRTREPSPLPLRRYVLEVPRSEADER